MSKILVTGGSGMVGHAIKQVKPDADFPTRSDLNLVNEEEVLDFIKSGHYDTVIHLAARVGGVKANTDYVGEFFTENCKINSNVLHSSMLSGVNKVVSMLSTCVYPDSVIYPITEEQLHLGPPHSSNFGYAYSKRMIEVQSRAYRQQYGCNFMCAIPNNLYGENDNYHLEDGHVIPALMRRIYEAKLNDEPTVEVWCDISRVLLFTYSLDIAEILFYLIDNYDESEPINIGYTDELSIREVAESLCSNLGYQGEIAWNPNMPNGQFRKPSSNKNLLDLGWDENKYTKFDTGIKKSCEWFVNNYPKIRGKTND